ncbi:MAG: hypothetical protein ACJAWA_001811 [Nonlabens sp.]|jgi:hypothetical protein
MPAVVHFFFVTKTGFKQKIKFYIWLSSLYLSRFRESGTFMKHLIKATALILNKKLPLQTQKTHHEYSSNCRKT